MGRLPIASVSIWKSVSVLEHRGCISMELRDWAKWAFEEVRAATRWSQEWKPEKWDVDIVVGDARFRGDAVWEEHKLVAFPSVLLS